MPISVRHKEGVSVVTLAGQTGIGEALALKDALMDAFAHSAEVRVEASELIALDITTLQALCAAHRYAEREGRRIALTECCAEAMMLMIKDTGFPRHRSCLRESSSPCLWMNAHEEGDE